MWVEPCTVAHQRQACVYRIDNVFISVINLPQLKFLYQWVRIALVFRWYCLPVHNSVYIALPDKLKEIIVSTTFSDQDGHAATKKKMQIMSFTFDCRGPSSNNSFLFSFASSFDWRNVLFQTTSCTLSKNETIVVGVSGKFSSDRYLELHRRPLCSDILKQA